MHQARRIAARGILTNGADSPASAGCAAGPKNQYWYVVESVNRERISLKNVYVFLMDEVLDFNCSPCPLDHPLLNAEGTFRKKFYDLIDSELDVSRDHRLTPRCNDPETCDAKIEELMRARASSGRSAARNP